MTNYQEKKMIDAAIQNINQHPSLDFKDILCASIMAYKIACLP